MSSPLLICGAGLRTAVGVDRPMSAAAVQAAISGFQEIPWWNRVGEHMVLAPAAALSRAQKGMDRWLALATPAFEEACSSAERGFPGARTGVFVCLPPPKLGCDEELQRLLTDSLRQRAQRELRIIEFAVLHGGHAVGFQALSQAATALVQGTIDVALVGGVDSFVDVDRAEALDDAGRLFHTQSTDGYIPGEAAAFCVVAVDAGLRGDAAVLCQLRSVATAVEPAPQCNPDAVCIGAGLTEALWGALSPIEGQSGSVHQVICDLNGEQYRTTEWSYSMIRTGQHFVEPLDICHPADCWGDLGAASAIALLGLAAERLRLSEQPDRRILVWGSSEEGLRGSVLLDKPPQSRAAHPLPSPTFSEAEARHVCAAWSEHLDEAAFLIEQRAFLLTDPEYAWPDLIDREAALRSHLAALTLYPMAVEPFLTEQLVTAEEPTHRIAAALALTSREIQATGPERVASALRSAELVIVPPLLRALQLATHPDWPRQVHRLLREADPSIQAFAAQLVTAPQETEVIESLRALVLGADEAVAAAAAEALGRAQGGAAIAALEDGLARHRDRPVNGAILAALLQLGHEPALDRVRSACRDDVPDWDASGLLSRSGGADDLRELARHGQGLDDIRRVHALGWLGNLAALPLLVERLDNNPLPELAAAAATALRRITGAPLFDEKPRPPDDEPDEPEEEPVPNELRGLLGLPPAPEPRQDILRTPTLDPARWRTWIAEHTTRWPLDQRFRFGQPWSPSAAWAALTQREPTLEERALLLQEAEIRTSQRAGLSIYGPVAQLHPLFAENAHRAPPEPKGAWLFAGRRI